MPHATLIFFYFLRHALGSNVIPHLPYRCGAKKVIKHIAHATGPNLSNQKRFSKYPLLKKHIPKGRLQQEHSGQRPSRHTGWYSSKQITIGNPKPTGTTRCYAHSRVNAPPQLSSNVQKKKEEKWFKTRKKNHNKIYSLK